MDEDQTYETLAEELPGPEGDPFEPNGLGPCSDTPATLAAEQWTQTLKRVANSVVVLKVTQTRAFDTEAAGSSYATGFVVDKRLGLILTNRHVVTPGPVVAEAVFQNREEVKVLPLYYDPVHDFGFFRFDPTALKFINIEEIELAPEAAAVGLDIRVVGNDSGEKLSILSGTIARLDRDAPHYSRRGFNDFNVHYFQAASGTKGGSSGSPVIDIHGRAVALNAGGKTKAASAYYFPLHRVVRALELLRGCAAAVPGGEIGSWKAPLPVISRGDLQATFVFKGFDEVKRLGLRPETEAAARAAQAAATGGDGALAGRTTGMLVVDSIVPGGPADGRLEPGDVLICLNGAHVSDFLTMESLLDDVAAAGGSVTVDIERGGQSHQESISVQNLHQVTPSAMLDLGGGSVHELSYQQARNNRSPVGQVYVAEPGYLLGKAGCPKHAIITALAGRPTPCLADFTAALLSLAHGQRVPLEYFTFDERFRRKLAILHVDFNWYSVPVRWERDDAAGVWNPTPLWPEPLKLAMSGLGPLKTGEKGGKKGGFSVEGSLPASPRLASPAIQGTCAAVRPPLPPGAKGGAAAGAAAISPFKPSAPPPLAIPRQHSVPDVAASCDLEKTQAGVTAQVDDSRLDSGTAGTDGPLSPHHPATPTAAGEAWRQALECGARAAMVAVDVEIPLVALADGVHSRAFSGCGIIVHLSDRLGLVALDRNTVSIGCGDIMLSLGAYPAEIPARVRFLHPIHNFALLSFDPGELSPAARHAAAAARLAADPPLARGDPVELISLSKSLRILHRTSMVTNPAMAVGISQADVPRFRAVHEEVIKIDQDFGVAYSGVLCDRDGGVRALWGSYSEQVDKEEREWTAGLAAAVLAPWVDEVVSRLEKAALEAENGPEKTGNGVGGGREVPAALPPSVRVLDAELEPLLLSKAAQFGLPGEWVARLMELDPERRQVLRVRSTVAGTPAQTVLRDGDMVLAAAGSSVSSFWDVENIVQAHPHQAPPPGSGTAENGSAAPNGTGNAHKTAKDTAFEPLPALPLTIFRDGAVLEVSVAVGQEDGLGTDRLVHWCGAQLQAPHRGVRELGFLPAGGAGVYVSRWHHGSPAHRFGLYALHWITEVNGRPVGDLDAFLEAVSGVADGADIRLKVVHFETTRPKVLTLKTDLRYWPTWELRLDAARAEWSRVELSGAAGGGV